MASGRRAGPPPIRSPGSALGRGLLFPLRWAVESTTAALARKTAFDGFTLLDGTTSADTEELFARVRGALELLRELDPRRYRRLRRDVPRLLLVRTRGGEYFSPTRTGTLRASLVRERPRATLAVVLVDLAARARLARVLRAYRRTPALERRVWRRAAREQLAFAARLPEDRFPGREALLDWVRGVLAGAADPPGG